MKWPWRKERVEERAGYSDLLLAGLETLASGSAGDVLRTSAVETAARIWSGALASASVTGGRGALEPWIMAMTGRQLIRTGEIVFVIEVRGGAVTLYPVTEFEVLDGMRYRCEIIRPPGKSVSRIVPSTGVIHWRWATDPREPWRGVAPMAAAALGGKLAANTETKLGEETSGPSALIVPIPSDGGAAALNQLRDDIAKAKGAAVLAESTAGGWDEGRARGTLNDWAQRRLGPDPPEHLVKLHQEALYRVLQACGVPAGLVALGVASTQSREDYRRFVMLTVEPLAGEMAAEASAKLDSTVTFGFHGLHAHDIVARSSAYAKLREAGVDAAEAMRLVGLE